MGHNAKNNQQTVLKEYQRYPLIGLGYCYSGGYFCSFYKFAETLLIAKTLGKYFTRGGYTSALSKSQV